MFHTATDASKVALMRLVDELSSVPDALLDVQWTTPHLISLGATDVDREIYRRRLEIALDGDAPPSLRGSPPERPQRRPSEPTSVSTLVRPLCVATRW